MFFQVLRVVHFCVSSKHSVQCLDLHIQKFSTGVIPIEQLSESNMFYEPGTSFFKGSTYLPLSLTLSHSHTLTLSHSLSLSSGMSVHCTSFTRESTPSLYVIVD